MRDLTPGEMLTLREMLTMDHRSCQPKNNAAADI